MTGFEHISRTHDITAAGLRPRVTPELVEHYVRRGERLRAEMLRRGGRKLWSGLAAAFGRRGRIGRAAPRPAH